VDGHLTRAGNDVVGNVLADALAPLIARPAAGGR
jgi:hypothetical protein